MKRCIVISGINLVDGGTYTIIRECLDAISNSYFSTKYRVIALVHKKDLFPVYSDIELIEFPKSKKNYFLRFYYEYIKFGKISKKLKPMLWLSLHDMSPIVDADIQAVYMHNPSPFLGRPKSLSLRGLGFSSLYKYIYRINIHSNDYLIVQQNWLRDAFSKMFAFPKEKIIVARPASIESTVFSENVSVIPKDEKTFVYASYPRGFKNFEVICEAVQLLEKKGINNFHVNLTLDGSENDYSKMLVEKFSHLKQLCFIGLQPRELMHKLYSESDCLIFTSKAETWGLPISEYMMFGKPMILADLPYAHETSAGSVKTAFVNPDDPDTLADRMIDIINNDFNHYSAVPIVSVNEPKTKSWEELFNLLIKE